MNKVFHCLLLLWIAGSGATRGQQPNRGLEVVRIWYENRETLNDLASRLDVWAIDHEKGFLEAAVRPDEARDVQDRGLRLELDPQKTQKLSRLGIPLENQTTGIPGYPCYRTVEETYAAAEAIAVAYPKLATWIDIGDSWEKSRGLTAGYDLFVLRLTTSSLPGPKPVFFGNFALHAREYTTAEFGTRAALHLVDRYGIDADITWLLDHHEIHLLLQTNPDGRKKAEAGYFWRKNTNNEYCTDTNGRGADLNRNFSFQWGCCGGSSTSPCSTIYHGAYPASEPEIEAMQNYMRSIFPDQRRDDLISPTPDDATGVAIDFHSHGRLVLWPWGFSDLPAPGKNGAALRTLGRKYSFFTGYAPKQAIDLYVTNGMSLDFGYGELGVASFLVELGTAFYQDCSSFEEELVPRNLDALIYAAKAARAPFKMPSGPDVVDLKLSSGLVAKGEGVALKAVLNDTRFGRSHGIEPSQRIAAAEYFVNDLPWEVSAGGVPLDAEDGTFDEETEGVSATIPTGGLPAGRHTIFVRGTDAAGHTGAVSATFLYVADPEASPILEGVIRDAETHRPLSAKVMLGGIETTTDPISGLYREQVPSGTYRIVVSASGYRPRSTEVAASDGWTMHRSFDLEPRGATVEILSPADSEKLLTPVSLRSTLRDLKCDPPDGGPPQAVAWTSSLDGELGTGDSVTVPLSEGTHVITASVRDPDTSSPAVDRITLEVFATCLPWGASCMSDKECCVTACQGKEGRKRCRN